MRVHDFEGHRRAAAVGGGEVSYVDVGEGEPILFVHGLFMSAYLWHAVIDRLRDTYRCIAIDLPAHGRTEVPDEWFGPAKTAELVAQFCDALELESVHLVGNDTGGAIAQLVTVAHPDGVLSLTLTNCDVHEHMPPEGFKAGVEQARRGELAEGLRLVATDRAAARASMAIGFERPEDVPDDAIDAYFARFTSLEACRDVEKRVIAIADEGDALVRIEPELRRLQVPTLIVWGTGDHFFDLSLAYWLRDAIPGATEVVEIEGARLLFPAERPDELVPHLHKHLAASGKRTRVG